MSSSLITVNWSGYVVFLAWNFASLASSLNKYLMLTPIASRQETWGLTPI